MCSPLLSGGLTNAVMCEHFFSLPCYRERERDWPGEDAAGSTRRASASGRPPPGGDGALEHSPGASPGHWGGPGAASSNGAGPSHYDSRHSGASAWPSGGGGNGAGAASAGGGGGEHTSASSSPSSVARVGLTRAPSGRRDADGQRYGTR